MSLIDGIPNSQIIDSLLTSDECLQLISMAETNGFVDVSPIGMSEVKECVRSIFKGDDGKVITNMLYNKIKKHLNEYNGHIPVGLNNYVRILKMVDTREGLFDHQDNSHKEGSKQSFQSLVIYLTNTKGGTGFSKVTVNDAVGRAVIFPHNVTHRSINNLSPNTRYVLRTDVMFEKVV